VLAAAALCALCAGCAAPKLQGPLLLHPVPPARDNYTLEQGAVVYTDPRFVVSARPWDYRVVAQEFRDAGEPNPFGDTDEQVGRFLFLRVRLVNRSQQNLVFNPMRAWLLGEEGAPLLPLENSDLFMLRDADGQSEALGRAFRRVSFDITATVRPGQTLERYLVFATPAEPAKLYSLVIEDLWVGAASLELRFGFEAFPGKEQAGGESPASAAGPRPLPVSAPPAPRPGP
jgi:hypothetical protein